MKLPRPFLTLLLALWLPLAALASPLDGRWRLDPARSTALDGWNLWDLVIKTEGSRVSLQHDMQWRTTKHSATNTVDIAQPMKVKNYFRVEQRHMALYPAKDGLTATRAAWIDGGRTLRLEVDTPIETSQGDTVMRIYSEYRVLEGGHSLVLIELHNSRPQPLVYRFNKVTPEN